MKKLVTLMLVYMLFSEALQVSAALKCCKGFGKACLPVECSRIENRCMTKTKGIMGILKLPEKKCSTWAVCVIKGYECCDTDLCNSAKEDSGAEGFDGVEYFDGTEGADGVEYEDGTEGVDGVEYVDGTEGADGVEYEDGTEGVDGVEYEDGTEGVNGTEGVKLSLLIMLVPLISSIFFI